MDTIIKLLNIKQNTYNNIGLIDLEKQNQDYVFLGGSGGGNLCLGGNGGKGTFDGGG